MPQSTVLILDDGPLHRDNPMLKALASSGKVEAFESLQGGRLAKLDPQSGAGIRRADFSQGDITSAGFL